MNALSSHTQITTVILESDPSMRLLITHLLEMESDIRVLGHAESAEAARALIKRVDPQVVILSADLADGRAFVFLKNLMRLRPTPVVMMCDTDSDSTHMALKLGAVDVVKDPFSVPPLELDTYARNLAGRLKAASITKTPIKVSNKLPNPRAANAEPQTRDADEKPKQVDSIIAIGSSTGGNTALRDIVRALPGDLPPIVIVQHIPADFSASFADGLDRISKVKIVHARQSQPLYQGHAYIAPGDTHMTVSRAKHIRLVDGELCNGHKPSVEMLFDSVTRHYADKACAVMLTGMGNDGAQAMLRMHQAGITTYAQDEKTSVVWGMPGAAVKLGAVDRVLPLNRIARAVSATAHALLDKSNTT
ncbi:MAG: chemotaxis-specific protein-glutamate methyltransferase CheB [Pseudomonadota bacterium]